MSLLGSAATSLLLGGSLASLSTAAEGQSATKSATEFGAAHARDGHQHRAETASQFTKE
jgi:hypothetical protein